MFVYTESEESESNVDKPPTSKRGRGRAIRGRGLAARGCGRSRGRVSHTGQDNAASSRQPAASTSAEFAWQDADATPQEFQFNGDAGVTVTVGDWIDPYACFRAFFTSFLLHVSE